MTKSPPVRGRGLKPFPCFPQGFFAESPPVRGRGLKLVLQALDHPHIKVAPRTGAWTETDGFSAFCIELACRPPYGGVD